MLTFETTENIQKIHKITGILNMRVRIEAIKKASTKIPQCKKCQGYNHTQRYCGREPRCVKCAGKHPTELCTLKKDETPKCVNCNGHHPASYRGCEVAKHLQKIRNQARKIPQQRPYMERSTNEAVQPKSSQRKTYAQVVENTKSGNDPDATENIRITLQAILNRLEEQTKLNTLIFDQLKLLGQPKNKGIRNK
jgi:hypothetical protein